MNKKGFSLIELLVVIVLIAIISIVAFVNFGNQAPKGRNSVRLNDLSTITTAIELARADKEYKFTTATGWENFNQAYLDGKTSLKSYLVKAPVDPSYNATTNSGKLYKIWGDQASYQIATTLEYVAWGPDLGSYKVSSMSDWVAAIAGNFVPTAVYSVNATTGEVTATGVTTVESGRALGKIGTVTGVEGVSATTIVVDGSKNLPY